ncbi:MAG: hypothetical protein QOI22_926 [Verrucomicrobiota bacterium]|jgi:DNA-binding MarR family transcriptional regulator
MRSHLSDEDYNALAGFRYAMRKFLRFSREFLAARAELTPEQYEALLALRTSSRSDGLTVGELSERLQVKHHSAVNLVNKLVARKLATRKTGQRDRRQVHVKLTSAGAKLLTSLAGEHRRQLRHRSLEMIKALTYLRG